MKVFKCCINCQHAMMGAVPKKPTERCTQDHIDRVNRFNATKRFCGKCWGDRRYNAFERRWCKGFEARRLYGNESYHVPAPQEGVQA